MIVNVEKTYNLKNDFAGYKITLSDDKEWFVPLDPDNKDYQAIQEWAKIEGNNIIDPGA